MTVRGGCRGAAGSGHLLRGRTWRRAGEEPVFVVTHRGQERISKSGGVRLFDSARVDLRCVESVQGEGAVHLRYEVA